MTLEKLLAKLQLCVDDPMWADHVEMPKQLLRIVIEQLGATAQGAPKSLTLTDITIHNTEVARAVAAQGASTAPLTAIQAASPDIIGVLKSVHSALDEALGDTDLSHIENDDDLRDVAPVQWAAQWLAHAIELLEGSAVTSTHDQPIEKTEGGAS